MRHQTDNTDESADLFSNNNGLELPCKPSLGWEEPCSVSLPDENRYNGGKWTTCVPMALARSRGLDYQVTFCARQPAPSSGLDIWSFACLFFCGLAKQPALELVLKLLQMPGSSPSQPV